MSIVLTRLQDVVAMSNLDKNEVRLSRYGVLANFIKNTDVPGSIITDDLKEKAINMVHSTVKAPVLDYKGVTITNTRTATIADDEATSGFQTITKATYTFEFTMVPTLYQNNYIGYMKDFDRKLLEGEVALGAALDTAGIAVLAAQKSQVFGDSLFYTAAANVLNAAYTDRLKAIGGVPTVMESNDFYRGIDMVGNMGFKQLLTELSYYGDFQATNYGLQFQDANYMFSNRITNAIGDDASWYAIEVGSTGILYSFEREAQARVRSATGHEWDIGTLPRLGIPVGTYYYESVGDFNAIAGAASADMTRAHKEHYSFSVDVAFVPPHNSDLTTIPSAILALAISDPV